MGTKMYELHLLCLFQVGTHKAYCTIFVLPKRRAISWHKNDCRFIEIIDVAS